MTASPPAHDTRRRAPALLLASAVLLAGCSLRAPAGPPPDATARITAAEIAAPIQFLSSDLLEGRGPGTRGDALARSYIATEMEAIGLQPGAPDGSWEQPMQLLGLTPTLPPHWDFTAGRRRLQLDAIRDFVATTGVGAEQAELRDPEVVFVGYGIEAPEQQWDDFKGADLRGKVLLMLNDDPDWDPNLFAGTRRLYYGRWTYKYESAARQGAAGAIIIHTTPSAAYPWRTVQSTWSGESARIPDTGEAALQIRAWVSEKSARRIVELGGQSLDDLVAAARTRQFRPVPLGVTTSLRVTNTVRSFETANVIGVLPGSDPALRHQAIVYTAHHDHLGMKRDAAGNAVIYNGALDNAAGVAQMLAVARAFAAAPAPRRSVIFNAVAAEEQGLLGSEYYVRHPTVPMRDTVANINFDGGAIWGRTRDVSATGYGKSTIDRWAAAAADRQGRVLIEERFPERGGFYRSDQFNFARAGVPVLYARGGDEIVDRPPGWGDEQINTWVESNYHQATDDFDPSWNLDGLIEDAIFAFDVGWALANTDEMPQWVPGDEFEAVRLRSLSQDN